MRLLTFFAIFIMATSACAAQKHDQVWLLGYGSNPFNTTHGGTIIDFYSSPADMYYEFNDMSFSQANASICDTAGHLLFYTNGIYIANALGDTMLGGTGLAAGPLGVDNQGAYGYILTQGAMALPVPGHDSLYVLFHADKGWVPPTPYLSLQSSNFYFSVVDMTLHGGLGGVVTKNQPFLSGAFTQGRITATKHANGRDWWLLARDYGTNRYHHIGLFPAGVQVVGTQDVGQPIPSDAIGQSVFSPDGTKYASVHLAGYAGDPIYVSIYDFDRCTGLLYDPVQFTHVDTAWAGGIAISPNNRFLYVSSFLYVYQYDLEADDIEASRITVAEWDGFYDNHPAFATTFYLMQLAPDGKIYINTASSTRYLHVINEPDSLGLACEVCQHCVELPTWNITLPNFPNYRLHHLEGSPCDTLRQPPLAAWGYTDEGPLVAFRDSSYHDIRTWQWDFGDGATSEEAHPVHAYTASGVYEVCLAVSNPRGADTLCQMVPVVVTGTSEVGAGAALSVYPNPNRGAFTLTYDLAEDGRLLLTDLTGRTVADLPLPQGRHARVIDTAGWGAGVYLLRVLSGRDGLLHTEKIILTN